MCIQIFSPTISHLTLSWELFMFHLAFSPFIPFQAVPAPNLGRGEVFFLPLSSFKFLFLTVASVFFL